MRHVKNSCIAFLLLFAACTTAQKSNLEIPPGSTLELDFTTYDLYELQLKNNTGKEIRIDVRNKITEEFVSGFGLGPLGRVEVLVAKSSKIVFSNTSSMVGRIAIKVTEKQAKKMYPKTADRISFTLINSSSESIPLLIPNVMNPNLSPNSSSGVDLKIGQELLFRSGLKKYVLLTVDENIKDGQELDVYKLLQERKKELGLK